MNVMQPDKYRLEYIFITILTLLCTSCQNRNRHVPQSWSRYVQKGGDADHFIDQMGSTTREDVEDSRRINSASREDFSNGKISTSFGDSDDGARAAIIQTDGKILLGGRTNVGSYTFFGLLRYFPDGSVDTTFGTIGRVITTISETGTSDQLIHSLALQGDGKIIAAGKTSATTGYNQIAVARYTTGGILDTTFFTTGKIAISAQNWSIARAVSVDASGKVVVGGYTSNGSRLDSIVSRFLSSGALDTSFATVGYQMVSFRGNDSGITSLGVQNDDKVVAGVNSYNGTNYETSILRLNTNGSLDTSFGTTGSVIAPNGAAESMVYALDISTSGQVALGGSTYNGSNLDFSLERFSSNGLLDTSFFTSGKVRTSIGSGDDVAFGVRFQTSGKLIMGGYSYNGSNKDFALVRYSTNGTLDTSFYSSGQAIIPVGSNEDVAQALAMLGDDYVVLAGRQRISGRLTFALARFNIDGTLAPTGGRDKSFGTSENVFTDTDRLEVLSKVFFQSDGRALLFGYDNNSYVIIRYDPSGNLDTTFATTGIKTGLIEGVRGYAYGGAVQADGKILMVGLKDSAGFSILRYLTNGSLDTAFNSTGQKNLSGLTTALGVVVQTDGRIIANGIGGSGSSYSIVRFATNGGLDTSFNSSGVVIDNVHSNLSMHSIGLTSDEKINLAGENGVSFAVARFLTNGVLDTSFFTEGFNSQSFNNHSGSHQRGIFSTDGSYLVVGTVVFSGAEIGLMRYSSSGALDTSFGTLGTVHGVSGFGHSIGLQVNERAVAGGSDSRNFSIQRYNPTGVVDTAFLDPASAASTFNASASGNSIIVRPNGRVCIGGTVVNENGDGFGIACFWP